MRRNFLDFVCDQHAWLELNLADISYVTLPPSDFSQNVTFAVLVNQIRECVICEPHLPEGANPVFRAHPRARILIVGQAPGIRVHNTGIPFNDPSGDRLREWMNVDKGTFYDTNQIAIVPMGFCYPGTGKNGDLPPRLECVTAWRSKIMRYLTNVELTIAIGQYAHRYHLGKDRKKNLTETVRNWNSYGDDIFPLPHPSPRNNIWLKKNPWFNNQVIPDLQRRVAIMLTR